MNLIEERSRRSCAATATLLCLGLALTTAVPAPATESVALGFVQSIADGDAEALYDFIRQNSTASFFERRSDDDWKALANQLCRHKGLEIQGLDIDGGGQVSVDAASPMGLNLFFELEFDSETPDKIASFSIQAGRPHREESSLPAFELPDGSSRDDVVRAVGAYLDGLGHDGLFSGSALIALEGVPLYRGAWGLASREWNAANNVETRFDLGSINKSFTKIAVGQLALAGKLDLDDTIGDHLPDYPNPDAAARVNIQHLLDHTSGIGDIFNARFFESAKTLYREPEDFFPIFAEEPLAFDPGTSTAYSNGGFMVLGAIIAAAAGQSYSDYVSEHIFDAAGMESTGFFARDEIVPNVAVGYTRMMPGGRSEELRNNLFRLSVRGSPAGSAFSNVDDMLAFDNALREHRLLAPAWTHWYFGGPEPAPTSALSSERARAATGIAGGAPGVSSVVESDGSLTLVVLSNQDEPGAEVVARQLRKALARALSSS